ncbi:hypothetical protein D3C79_966980 [compost metagenome]
MKVFVVEQNFLNVDVIHRVADEYDGCTYFKISLELVVPGGAEKSLWTYIGGSRKLKALFNGVGCECVN